MEDSKPIYAEKCGFRCIHPTEWSVGGTGRPLPALPADVPRFNLIAIHAFGSMESGWSGFDRVCLLLLKKQSKAGPVQTGRLGISKGCLKAPPFTDELQVRIPKRAFADKGSDSALRCLRPRGGAELIMPGYTRHPAQIVAWRCARRLGGRRSAPSTPFLSSG